ncbi:MAG TPA: hypothetical protein VIH82_00745 [Acidimicrobiia bacterium]|jgi:hypothetical protein
MLAATSTDTFSVPVLVAAAGVALGWWVVLAVVVAARRPPRIASRSTGSLDLPPEPPAVAGILANDFEVTAETAPGVVLDLAARGFAELDEVQPGKTVCRIRSGRGGALTDYERLVLTELAAKAVDGVVPADALTTGPEIQSKRWHRTFAGAVIADANGRGLTVPRWPRALTVALGFGLGAVAALLFLSSQVSGEATDDDATLLGAVAAAVAVATIVIGGFVVGRLAGSLALLPTAAGRDAADRVAALAATLRDNEALGELPPAGVKLWDRLFAYAAVFGAAPLAVALLPMGAEDDHRAWSRVGGRWRTVRVRYPRALPPAWGKHPIVAAALALLWGAVAALVAYGLVELRSAERPSDVSRSAWQWVDRGTAIAFVPVLLVLAWSLWVLWRAVPDLWQTRTVVGEIVRGRRFRQWFSSGDDPDYWCYLAVDDGSTDRIAAWRVREIVWSQHSQGDAVRTDLTPRLGYVRSMTSQ